MGLLTSALLLIPLAATLSQAQEGKPAFTFVNQGFYHRYTKANFHEFTPKGQSDLKKWTDMITINDYPDAKDGEALAARANAVLENYKANKAMVVKTGSVPRSEKGPAEHLIVVLFPRPDFIEASFARFVLSKGAGVSVVYSHRIYGKKAGDAMSQWLRTNGEKREKALMGWTPLPRR